MGDRPAKPAPAVNDRFDGPGLYRLVEQYAAFGAHHTASRADRETLDWVASLLEELGATTSRYTHPIQRWVGSAQVTLSDGTAVPCEPLFYSAVGSAEVENVEVFGVETPLAAGAAALHDWLTTLPAEGALVAVPGPDDLVVQCNRVPQLPDRPVPAAVIPHNWADRARAGASLRFTGDVSDDTSDILLGRLGSGGSDVTVTTPLSGWFPCAGERGTGLAVAIAIAADLAVDHRVTFVGCSSHELDHVGLFRYLDDHDVTGQRVIHLGASVGAVEFDERGDAALGSSRMVLTTDHSPARAEIAAAAANGNWRLADPTPWPGEGRAWRQGGANVLSFVGSFPLFHTAADLPAAATSPLAMRQAYEAASTAVEAFLASNRP